MQDQPNNDQPTSQPSVEPNPDTPNDQPVDVSTADVEPSTQPTPAEPQVGAAGSSVDELPKPASAESSFQSEFAAAAAAEPVESPYAAATAGKSRSKKGILIGLVTGAVLLLGGGAAAYTLWYQNPERVVNSAVAHFMSQKYVQTQTVITSDDSLVTGIFNVKLKRVTIDAAVADAPVSSGSASVELSFNGNDYKLSGDGRIVDGDTIYFRINDIKDTYEKVVKDFGMTEADIPADVKTQIENMQNKWVKVTPDDMDENKEAFVCSMNAIRTHAQSDESFKYARDKYSENAFIATKEKTESKDGLVGYKVEVDNAKLKEFMKTSEESPLAKALDSCVKDSSDSKYDSETKEIESATDNTKFEFVMWVTRFSHQMKKLDYTIVTKNEYNNGSDYTLKGSTSFDYSKANIETPADSIELKKWQESLEGTAGSVLGADTTFGREALDINEI